MDRSVMVDQQWPQVPPTPKKAERQLESQKYSNRITAKGLYSPSVMPTCGEGAKLHV